MKKCCKCKLEKTIDFFNFKDKTLGIRHNACKICTRLEVKKHYYNNKSYYLRKAKNRNNFNRNENTRYILNYFLTHPCIDCGEKDPVVLEFDHTRDKKFNVSLIKRDQVLTKVIKEIEKCVVRCSNCHKKKTAKEYGWYKNFMPL